jgi:hypothetical protein
LESREEFTKLIVQIIEDDLTFDLSGYSDNLKSHLDAWRSANSGENFPSIVIWELTALDAMADIREDLKPDEPYFRSKLEFINRETNPPTLFIYPDVGGTLSDDNAVSYYQARFNNTKNPIRKARFADLVWEALRSKHDRNAYIFGIEAGNAYLSQLPLYISNSEGLIYLTNNMQRAAEISFSLNNQDLSSRVLNNIIEVLPSIRKSDGFHYISVLIKTLDQICVKFSDLKSNCDWKSIRELCLDIIQQLENSEVQNYLLLNLLLHSVMVSSNYIGDYESVWDCQVNIAEIPEKELKAREIKNGESIRGLVSLKFMQDSMYAFNNLISIAPNEMEKKRVVLKVEEMKREVRRLIRQTEDEMGEIRVSNMIPNEILDNFIKPFLEAKPEDVLSLLSNDPKLTPNLADLQVNAQQIRPEVPLLSLINTSYIRDGRSIEGSPFLPIDPILSMQADFWFQTNIQSLNYLFHGLIEEGKITKASLIYYFQSWELFDLSDLPFLDKGISHYFEGDYVSALHLLIPRIEHILKSAFEKLDIPLLVLPNEHQIREQTLGDFLNRDDVKKVVGESVWYYLNYVLINEIGLNLRNEIAHGWIKIESCDKYSVQVVLFCILLLTRLKKKNKDEG